jgi:hypothetical protein
MNVRLVGISKSPTESLFLCSIAAEQTSAPSSCILAGYQIIGNEEGSEAA